MSLLGVQMTAGMSRWGRLDVQMAGPKSRRAYEESRILASDVQMADWVSR